MKRTALILAMAAASLVYEPPRAVDRPSRIEVRALAGGEAELLIYGMIGEAYWNGVSAQSIVAQLSYLSATTIRVRINSDGGDASEGLAIYNALKQHGARIVVTVDGVAASIASLIAMAGDEVQMPPTSTMMLHMPWTPNASGNANDLRDTATQLDVYNEAMLAAYAAKSGKSVDELRTLLGDGRDHWYTAEQAVAAGFADTLLQDDEATPLIESDLAAAALLAYVGAIASAPMAVATALRGRIQAAAKPHIFAALTAVSQRAVMAHIEDESMRKQFSRIMANAAGAASAPNPAPAADPTPNTPTAPVAAAAAAAPAAAPSAAPAVDPSVVTSVLAALGERNTQIRGVFAAFRGINGVPQLENECLADPQMTVQAAQQRLLQVTAAAAQPIGGFRVEAGADQVDRTREACVNIILARSGSVSREESDRLRQGNPFIGATLIDMAEQALIRAGVNTRQMGRDEIARRVLAAQTTSDFPILLENVLHKMLLNAYALASFTWNRFCATGTLSDYRPHNRYHLSSFSDLKEVNEHGEYESGVLGDGAKETIQGKRKGRILRITPEILVNDDIGAISRPTIALSQAAGRTIEKDVYAMFGLNSGNGPTMSDGNPLFHSSHGNIAGTGAAPTNTSVDAARQQMSKQMDVGNNDYLDLTPAIWLGPTSLGSVARTVNEAQYDVTVSNKFQVPNVVRGLFRDVIDSPRLADTVWYALADPNIEPVFEVAFLDGVQTPTLEQQSEFNTDALAWKVVHRYGVAAVGWRGIVKNPGQ
ncbi:MAG: ClpP-like prohead protease/major capsid protein fusion protein [Dokdonella sp.]|uniref:ClpP-like prohead protease/major capsid protein fusion protein n=1 Tax=Dokdonella sp. TaxID=2291710 RepID=UPI003F7FC1ED